MKNHTMNHQALEIERAALSDTDLETREQIITKTLKQWLLKSKRSEERRRKLRLTSSMEA